MSARAPFEPIAALLERGLSIRNVFGDPVTHGDVTVITVAQVACAFGAGGGAGLESGRPPRPSDVTPGETPPEIEGAGGGGALRMTPLGALEISPRGTRFIRYPRSGPVLVAAAIGLAVGFLLACGRR